MFECDPQGIAQKRDEDVRFHAMLFLMENRADGQFAFQCTEDRFGFGQLDVFLPDFFGAFFLQVRAEQVGAFARIAPGTAPFNQLPFPDVVHRSFPGQPPYRGRSRKGVVLESFPASVRSSIDLSTYRRRCAFPIGPALFPYWWRRDSALRFLWLCAPWTGTECRFRLRRASSRVAPRHRAGSSPTRRRATAFQTASASRAAYPPDTVRPVSEAPGDFPR